MSVNRTQANGKKLTTRERMEVKRAEKKTTIANEIKKGTIKILNEADLTDADRKRLGIKPKAA
jgi:hypothetical protein